MQHGGTRFFPELDRALRVERTAVPGVRVGEHGHRGHAADAPDVLEHLRLRQHAEIGLPRDDCARDEPAHVDRGRAGLFRELGGDGVVSAQAHERRLFQQLAKASRTIFTHRPRIAADRPRDSHSCLDWPQTSMTIASYGSGSWPRPRLREPSLRATACDATFSTSIVWMTSLQPSSANAQSIVAVAASVA